MDLLRQLFLNPAMLAGTALVGVPIIIYLINRQRFERRRWAAMEFLLRAMRRNRRRIQLQNLLLLLVRCMIVLGIVLAAARPVSRLSMLSFTPDQNQSWIFAVDVSYSMGYQEESRSLFEQARETILSMLDGLLKPGDQVAVMTLEEKPRIVLLPTKLNEEGLRTLRREVDSLRLTTGSVDLGASFAVLDELCGKLAEPTGAAVPKRILVLSDLQRKDWMGQEGPRAPGVVQYIDKIQKEGGAFAFAELASRQERSNLAVTDLRVKPALIAQGVWVELSATVKCFGNDDFQNIDLTLRVDQDADDRTVEPQVGQVIRVARGEAVSRSLAYRFDTPGLHTAIAEVRSDGLVIDNRRFLTVKVEESVKVLLVDGDPSADPTERETFQLQVALEPDDDAMGKMQGRFTPFETRYATVDQLGDVRWRDHAVVILANVPELTESDTAQLEEYVQSGGALIVFLGENVRSEWYNQHFRREKPYLMPLAMGEVYGDKQNRHAVNLQAADENHPLVQYFSARKEVSHLDEHVISFYQYFRMAAASSAAPENRSGLRLAFEFNDSERSPAVFDNPYGLGRVLWVTTTADNAWNELSNWPDFVVLLHESISYLVGFGLSASNLKAGETFRKVYPASQYAPEILLHSPEAPGGEERVRTTRKVLRSLAKPEDAPASPETPPANGAAREEAEFELTHEDTDIPGNYRIELRRPQPAGSDSVEHFSVNVDIAESDLRPMTDDDFSSAYEVLKLERFDATERLKELKEKHEVSRGKEHWAWIAALVLALLFAESIMAWLFGRRSR